MEDEPQEQTVEEMEEIPNAPRPAFDTADDAYFGTAPLYKVGEDGTPEMPINIDLKVKDLRSLWVARERLLWFALVICALYFVLVLVGF